MTRFLLFLLFSIPYHLLLTGVVARTFTLVNQCEYPVWPGILSNAGSSPLSTTGFSLQKGQSKSLTPPAGWGGRFWGRTLCAADSTTGKFTCQTGDCGTGRIDCAGAGAAPPATLAEFKLDGDGGLDFYDVSLVDGYNLPMLVVPDLLGGGGGGGNCSSTGCVADINAACPAELRVMSDDGSERVACKSACDAFDQPQYCCSGAYANPDTCKPSGYSLLFKRTCPRAYSYAYDDRTSTFTCGGGGGYTITFCPSPSTSQKASSEETTPLTESTPTTDSSDGMVYEGSMYPGSILSSSSPSTCINKMRSRLMAGLSVTTVLIAIGRLWQLC